jgi:SAM-dependent methyltransferase
MSEKLRLHRETWNKKKILREIYRGWYRRILKDLKKSNRKSVEIGAGIGNFKEFMPEVIASDIEACDWLDLCFDAQQMPFGDNEISNVVMIDVLHHLSHPLRFLREASRVLKKGGRLIMIEPYPSILSLPIYRAFHPEPFIFDVDYFGLSDTAPKEPWEANQAAAYLTFFRDRKKFNSFFSGDFRVVKRQRMSCVLYPLSGGFEHRSLIPEHLMPFFELVEVLTIPFRYFLAFRCYVLLEKK